MSDSMRIAVVTGGNRGLGKEVCRQLARKGLHVILTARDESKGKAVAAELADAGRVTFHQLDVTDPDSIRRLREDMEREFGRVDVLVNCAGVMLDHGGPEGASVFRTDPELIRRTMEVNVYGPMRLIQEFVPLMRRNKYGRIVNFSSGMGQLEEMNGGWPGYRISKTALNALTRIVQDELADEPVLVNSLCPGWVRTDMGGPHAERSVEEGADTAVWLATLPDDGPRGGFFRDREPIPW